MEPGTYVEYHDSSLYILFNNVLTYNYLPSGDDRFYFIKTMLDGIESSVSNYISPPHRDTFLSIKKKHGCVSAILSIAG